MGAHLFLQIVAATALLSAALVLARMPEPTFGTGQAILAAAIFLHVTVDVATLGLGVGLYSTLFLALPVISLGLFAPEGLVQTLFNSETGLVDRYWRLMLPSMSYFWAVWSLLLVVLGVTAAKFDRRLISLIRDSRVRLGQGPTALLSVISMAAAFIYRPGLPGGAYRSVEFNLLPGNAWNTIAVMALFLVLLGERSALRTTALVIVPSWLLLHFARVDVLGFVAFSAFVWIRSTDRVRRKQVFSGSWRHAIASTALAALGLVAFAYIGTIRGQGLQADPAALVRAVVALTNYPTVQDVVYSTAAALHVRDQYGGIGTLATLGHQLLPSFVGGSAMDAARSVSSVVHTNNGMLLPGEFYLNFGMAGLYIAPIASLALVGAAAKTVVVFAAGLGSSLQRIAALSVYAALWISGSRVMWYGFIYYLNAVLLVVPMLVLLCWLISAPRYRTDVEPPAYRAHVPTISPRATPKK